MMASAGVTLVLAACVWLWVRNDPSERGYASHAHPEALNNSGISPRHSLKLVVSERDTWLLFFAGGLLAAPVLTFAGLWGVPYLVQVYGLERSHAAVFTTTMLLGFAVGGPLLGALSDRIGRRKLRYLGATLVHAFAWVLFLLIDDLSVSALYLLFAVIGFSAGGLIIGFAFSREVNHPGAAGTVGGVVNMALKRCAADAGAVTLIQRFGSAANLNVHLHCLVLDGVYRRTEGEPIFDEARAPANDELKGLLNQIVARLMKMLTRTGPLVEEQGMT